MLQEELLEKTKQKNTAIRSISVESTTCHSGLFCSNMETNWTAMYSQWQTPPSVELNRGRSQRSFKNKKQKRKTGAAPASEGEFLHTVSQNICCINISNWYRVYGGTKQENKLKLQPPVGVVSSASFLLAY